MLAEIPLPRKDEVCTVLSALFTKEVQIEECSPTDQSSRLFSIYSIGSEQIALAIFDVSLACGMGAALTLMPGHAAEEWVSSNDIPESAMENFGEICNICSQLFIQEDSPRAVFREVATDPASLCEIASRILGEPRSRVDFQIDLDGYPGGVVTLLS